MKWKTSEKLKAGETRIITCFAFWPTELDDGYTVFLRFYKAKEVWSSLGRVPGLSGWITSETWSE